MSQHTFQPLGLERKVQSALVRAGIVAFVALGPLCVLIFPKINPYLTSVVGTLAMYGSYFFYLWSLHKETFDIPSTSGSIVNLSISYVGISLNIILCGLFWYLPFGFVTTFADAFYFSTVTFTTLGYGDITPDTGPGKIFAAGQALLGTTVMITFIASFLTKIRDRE